jgi:hypothetical protein
MKTLEQERPMSRSRHFADHLDEKLEQALQAIEDSEMWQVLSSPETAPELVRSIIKNVMLETFPTARTSSRRVSPPSAASPRTGPTS